MMELGRKIDLFFVESLTKFGVMISTVVISDGHSCLEN